MALQAALLAPPAVVAEDSPDAEMGEEEEMAVDFEADDVEPPAAAPAPAPATTQASDLHGAGHKIDVMKEFCTSCGTCGALLRLQ